jgi:(p)ppGpp synthase/HD superfamily hydrolase
MAYVVARRLRPAEHPEPEPGLAEQGRPLAIRGAEGMVMQYARCCHPIPGDSIIGHISSGRGLVVHRTDCRNIGYLRDNPEKTIYLEWSAPQSNDEEFVVGLYLEVESQRGIIANLATAAASVGANLLKIDSGEREGQLFSVQMELTVYNRVHLARVIRKLRSLRSVNRINRQ